MEGNEKKSNLGKYDIKKRWTPKLAEAYTPVPEAFLKHYSALSPAITSAEAMLVIHILAYKWNEKAPYPAFKTVGKRMGITDAQARNHARSLETKGYLWREKRVGTTNKFHFDGLFKALEAQLDKVKKLADEDDEPQRESA